jgi:hypothetical protein
MGWGGLIKLVNACYPKNPEEFQDDRVKECKQAKRIISEKERGAINGKCGAT